MFRLASRFAVAHVWPRLDRDGGALPFPFNRAMSAMEAASSEGEPEPDPEADAAALADSLKTEGNQLLTDGKFGLAADKYTEALTLNPESAILYSNRAMAYMKMESYGLAIADAEEAIHLDRTYVKVRSFKSLKSPQFPRDGGSAAALRSFVPVPPRTRRLPRT